VSINLGIDFGTSFTKIFFRDVGTEESGVVAVGSKFKNGLIPSVVAIGNGGRLCLQDEITADTSYVSVPYLKMRLAGSAIGRSYLRSTASI
jgi:molecular chaperone DnaK (HSP70)